jgi:hypothetical protein
MVKNELFPLDYESQQLCLEANGKMHHGQSAIRNKRNMIFATLNKT